jgi:hypothetical protein
MFSFLVLSSLLIPYVDQFMEITIVSAEIIDISWPCHNQQLHHHRDGTHWAATHPPRPTWRILMPLALRFQLVGKTKSPFSSKGWGKFWHLKIHWNPDVYQAPGPCLIRLTAHYELDVLGPIWRFWSSTTLKNTTKITRLRRNTAQVYQLHTAFSPGCAITFL